MDLIVVDESLKQRTLQAVLKKKNSKKKYIMFGSSLVITTICIFLIINTSFLSTKKIEEYSYISIDVNPSLEFVLDKQDIVINMIAYNEEASILIEKLKYDTLTYKQVLNNLMELEDYQQYLQPNAFMQVSVYSKDFKKSKVLEEEVNKYLDTTTMQSRYQSSCVDTKTHHQANMHHMSSGKYSIVEDILVIDSSRSMEELNEKSIEELMTIYQQLTNKEYSSRHSHNQKTHHQGHKK